MSNSNLDLDEQWWQQVADEGIGDTVDTGLWPELPQMDNNDLVNSVFVIKDARRLDYDKAKGPFYICKCMDRDGELFTCAMGGVVRDKIDAIAAKGTAFEPNGRGVAVRLVRILSGQYAARGYLDLIDPRAPLPQKAEGATAGLAEPQAKAK